MGTEDKPADKEDLDPVISSEERTALPAQEVPFFLFDFSLFWVQKSLEYTLDRNRE